MRQGAHKGCDMVCLSEVDDPVQLLLHSKGFSGKPLPPVVTFRKENFPVDRAGAGSAKLASALAKRLTACARAGDSLWFIACGGKVCRVR